MIADLFFLPAIAVIGLITSIQDIQSGKIKNKWIKLGLLWCLAGYLIIFVWFKLSVFIPAAEHLVGSPQGLSGGYFFQVILNSALALLFGYILWHFDLWSAGDGKLFFIFSLLLPLKYYSAGAFPFFPSLALLLNIFALAFFFLVVRTAIVLYGEAEFGTFSLRRAKNFVLESAQKLKKNYATVVETIVLFFSILLIFQIIRYEIRLGMGLDQGSQDVNGWLIVIFFLISRSFIYFRRLMKKKWLLALVYAAVIPFLWWRGFFSSAQNVAQIWPLIQNSLLFSLFFTPVIALLIHARKKKGEKEMSFAVWIFVGVIATILAKGSLFSLFSGLFHK